MPGVQGKQCQETFFLKITPETAFQLNCLTLVRVFLHILWRNSSHVVTFFCAVSFSQVQLSLITPGADWLSVCSGGSQNGRYSRKAGGRHTFIVSFLGGFFMLIYCFTFQTGRWPQCIFKLDASRQPPMPTSSDWPADQSKSSIKVADIMSQDHICLPHFKP